MREVKNFNQMIDCNNKGSHTKVISHRNKAKTIGTNINIKKIVNKNSGNKTNNKNSENFHKITLVKDSLCYAGHKHSKNLKTFINHKHFFYFLFNIKRDIFP